MLDLSRQHIVACKWPLFLFSYSDRDRVGGASSTWLLTPYMMIQVLIGVWGWFDDGVRGGLLISET
jgi:hypothetical protein